MCGICGFTWQDETLVQAMTQTLSHRGPDQQGIHSFPGVSFGHRRLSIIDLSELGRQPIFNEDGSVIVVFNGEIYNFASLRIELEKLGHTFRGHSDSETIVHAYEEYGVDCVHHFQGMFAFAAWDQKTGELFIARDRIGIKPLYYAVVDDQLLFASEIKSLLACPKIERKLNRQALYHYLGHEFVPGPMTMFEGIHKLPAGHCLKWKHGEMQIDEWWDIAYPDPPTLTDPQAAIEQVQFLLEQAVKDRLVSDVPLGAFLSGGLDSSAIVAMMRKHVTGTLRTFTIGYEDKSFSELDYAKTVSDQFGTESHVLMVNDMTPELIEQSIWHLDEPMTDLSSIPLMLLCEKAKQDVSVILSGEGGDEIFAGYDRFKASKLNSYYRMIPRIVREKMVAPLLLSMPDQPQKKGAINMLKRFVEGSLLPEEAGQIRWQFFLSSELEQNLFSDEFRKEVTFDPFGPLRACRARCNTQDRVNRELYLDTRFVMVDSVLMKVDKMSMASALEIRVPFLDHRLVEGMARIPGNLKLKGMETKSIFRKALEDYLPEHIVYRGKQGYSLPVKHLLRNELREYMTTTLMESSVIRENMNLTYVQTLIQEHVDQKHNHNHVLWGLLNVAIWHRRFFEGN
jgi:asparagine synthase (glutamine-hydrolysing)